MTECQLPDQQPADEEINAIINEAKTIAVVGISDKEDRASYKVAKYLQQNGYIIIPVNPTKDEILGEKCYPDLKSIPVPVDIVDVFRKVEAIPAIADAALDIKAKVVWLQLGLAHNESAQKLR